MADKFEDFIEIKQDKEKKKKSKKNKKIKKRDKDKTGSGSDDSDIDPQKLEQLKKNSKVWNNPNIPQDKKQLCVEIETNPLNLIIGNTPMHVTQEEIKEYFLTLLVCSNPQLAQIQPIRRITLGEQKNYVVIEFANQEAKNLCKKLCTNLEYQGFQLQIQNRKGFFEKIYEKSDSTDLFGNIITNVSDIDNKIYMGGLPTYLSEENVRKLCETYGMLKYFNLVKDLNQDGSQSSKGYCFFEYQDPKVTEKAVKGLNNLEIGDRKLKVQKAQLGANKSIAQQQQKKEPTNAGGSFLASFPLIREQNIQQMLNIPVQALTPSRVVQLLNLCTPEDLIEDDFYEDLMRDVAEECQKQGLIENIIIPRPDPQTGIVGPSVGKIFVKFQYLIPAKRARYILNGKIYNNRTVIASFYNEQKFDMKDYLYRL